ncbi:hypothetical protein HanIR_Chr17g0886301 [Helianthus annuus]|nr:hypothetical protein HanIR_Chr17g0886301 [Helianthus annuus]
MFLLPAALLTEALLASAGENNWSLRMNLANFMSPMVRLAVNHITCTTFHLTESLHTTTTTT